MSKVVDERVVEMRFDNRQFESNVHTSMSTLEKLKRSLNLTGASKGLENVNAAAKRVDMNGLGSGVDTVTAKFSALQVMGVTALANITNSAVNAGKRIVSALTIDPIKSGFQEYETQINAVQTILANTQKEGATIRDVNAALDELNLYADKTIYNFTEMTRNIGTFTAAGVDLKTSVSAIQGIANLAAVSGSTSQQASTAMYQLSQALATGTVKLMDWNSVVNAGMGGQVFQDALRETSELLGTGAEAAIKAQGSFRESLQTGWLTSEVLTETLKKFTTSGANEYVAEYTGLSKEAVEAALEEAEARYGEADAIEYASKALAEKSGKNAEEIKSALQFAKTAEDAATKVKTLTQLWDVLKEAAQSGWSQTWRIIIGDFEAAKALFTPLADFLTNVINKMSNARNTLLESALGKGFSSLSEKLKGLLEPAKKAVETVENVKESIADLGAIVDDVIIGKFGNGQERFNALTEAGHNYYEVQNKVNETLGNSFRYSQDQIDAQNKLLGVQKQTTEATSESAEETTKLTDTQKDQIKQLAKLSDEQLKAKGYTKEQIAAFNELRSTADKLGLSVDDLIDNIDDINGRWLLLNSFKNIGQAIVKVFSAIGKAWREIFEGIKPEQLFNAIAGFHKFTSSLVISDETAKNLTRTFKGLFAILDIISTIAGGGLKLAFKVLSKILGAFDMDILSLTASLGDAIVKFRDFLFDNELINKGFELLAKGIEKAVSAIKKLVKAFKNLPQVQKFIKSVKDAIEDIQNIDLSSIGENILAGLKNGLSGGISDIVGRIAEIAQNIIETFCSILGIHSPSTVFFEFGKNIIEGLANGIKSGIEMIINAIKFLGEKIVEIFKGIDFDINLEPLKKAFEKFKNFLQGIDFSKLLAIVPIAVVLLFAKKLYDIASVLADGISGINSVISGFADVEKSLSKVLKSFSTEIKAKALQKIAIAIAILVGSVIALTLVDTDKLYGAVFTIITLAGVLVALAWAMGKIDEASLKIDKNGASLSGLKTGLISIGASILMLAAAVKIMGSMNMDQMKQGFIGLAGVVAAVAVVFLAFGVLAKADATSDIDKAGSMILKISFAMLLMVGVCKLAAMLTPDDMINGAKFAAGFAVFVAALCGAARIAGSETKKIGSMVLKLSVAMLLLVGVCKLVSMLKPEEMLKGAAFAAGFLVFVTGLVLISKLFPDAQIQKVGRLVLSLSVSLLLLVGVCKLVSMLKPEEMLKGAAFAAGFLVFVLALVKITTISNEEKTAKVAATILAFSIAIGILAAVSILMSMMSLEGLAKGVGAVAILGLVMAGMIKATKGASDVMKNLIVMTIAIAVMAGAVAALSLIDGTKLAGATLALSTLMGMFALMSKAAGNMKGSMGSLLAMTAVVGALAGIIYLLSGLPIENVLTTVGALSVLLISLSASMYIISNAGTVAPMALAAMGALTLVVGGLALILGLLSAFNVETSLQTVTSLSVLLLALSGATVILSTIQTVSPMALAAIGVMTLVVAGLAAILGVLACLNVGPTLEIAASLSLLLMSLSGACAILGVVGLMGPAAFVGIGALVTLITSVGALMIAIGALATYFPQMEEFLNRGLPLLEQIGYGLGSFVGNVIGGLMDGVMSSLSQFGIELSNFMTNLQPFLDGASSIDEASVTGIKTLAEAILTLTGASLVESITSFLSGGSSLADFAAQLVPFGQGMKAYADAVTGINTEAITMSATAAKGLAEVANAIPKEGGLWQLLAGGQDLGSFGAKLVPFGQGMKAYADAVVGINTEAITASATAAKGLADVANAIPKEGGLWGLLSGDKDLGSFGTKLVPFGEGMKKYAEKVTGIDTEAIVSSASAAKAMVKVADAIPKEGGLWGLITGDKDLGSFGKKLVPFGESMKKYADKVTGIDTAAITSSVSAAKAMVNVADAIPDDLSVGAGSDAISSFGSKMSSFAGAMKTYADKVAGINAGAISSSVMAAKNIVSLIKSTTGINTSGVSSFVSAVNTLGKAQVSKFVSAFTSSTGKLKAAGASMLTAVVSGIKSRQSSLVSTATSLVSLMYRAFASKASMFKSAGSTLMAAFISGIVSRRSSVNAAVASTVSGAASSLRSRYSAFYSAGAYLARGFANGISSGTFAAAARARAMAKAAEEAARSALKINSPSKVFMKIGAGVPEGFAKGIVEAGYYIDRSIHSMTKDALQNTKSAIARVADVVQMDIDSQPTIRPVMDLSNVQSGVGAINTMFNKRLTLGATANVNAISASMANRNQNGSNDDVISAINKLRKGLENTSGNTYIIDGVTYDDGSNISEAVQTLVRAATVERRI